MGKNTTHHDEDPEGQEEKVGYGHPPKRTQFKTGQTGNPNGRPKGQRNKRSIIREVVERKVTVMDNGKEKTMSVYEAMIQNLIAKALNGKTGDQIRVLQLIEKYLPNLGDEENHQITVRYVDVDGSTYS